MRRDGISRAAGTDAEQYVDKPEIDYTTMKLIVGLIAISLSGITASFAKEPLLSISHAYCADGKTRDFFIGFLFAIAALMTAHNGASKHEKIASKVGGMSAVGIALVPTACTTDPGSPWHFVFASIMFSILAWFCWSFYQRTKIKPHQTEAARRRVIYGCCGIGIVISMLLIAAKGIFGWWQNTNATFLFEAVGLALFGISWLIASHFLPFFDHPSERRKLT